MISHHDAAAALGVKPDATPEQIKGASAAALGVKPDATPEQIKGAFRRRARAAHPDLHSADKERAAAAFRRLEAARAVLSGEVAASHTISVGPQGSAEVRRAVEVAGVYAQAVKATGDSMRQAARAAVAGDFDTVVAAGRNVGQGIKIGKKAVEEVVQGPLGQIARGLWREAKNLK